MTFSVLIDCADIVMRNSKHNKSAIVRLRELDGLCLENRFNMSQEEVKRFEEALYLFYELGYREGISEN